MEIKIELTKTPKQKPDEKHLGFGSHYTDHMFIMNYDEGQGWHDARIVPYQPITLEPSALVFHYAQECFEGLKAYRCPDGSVQLFRPDKNAERMQSTHKRLCIPEIPVADFVDAVKALVSVEKDWVPSEPDTSLYIRPFTIATEPVLGVKASAQYQFIIICSPSGAYYAEGMNPVKIYVEDEFVRATPGGTGYITDLGMCGSMNGVLGVKTECIIHKFTVKTPMGFEPAEGGEMINGAIFEIDTDTKKCVRCAAVKES